MFDKKLIFALILLIVAIGAVSAADLNSTDDVAGDDVKLSDEVLQSESVETSDSEVFKDSGDDSDSEVESNSSEDVKSNTLKLSASKLTATYGNSMKFKVNVKDDGSNPVSGITVKIKVNGKTYSAKSNGNGVASMTIKKLDAGTYSVKISIDDDNYVADAITSSIKVNPSALTIQSRSETYVDKEKVYSFGALTFKIKNKSNKYLNGIKVTLKIYTGKKYKTIKLVTGYDSEDNQNGVCAIATNKFSAGTHKVKVSITSKNYKGSKTVKLKIPKAAKKCYFNKHYVYFTGGKTKTNIK